MKIIIQRGETKVDFEVNATSATLLEVLEYLKAFEDNTLAFSSGCRSGVCGSCAMRVNDKEVLACSYIIEDGDIIAPLKNLPLLRDLVVDMDSGYEKNQKAKAWLSVYNTQVSLGEEDEKINALQSDCILCGSCYSACPVYEVNQEFLGPFALTRVWRYVSDKREANTQEKIEIIQKDGVWDCTLCDGCTLVCPQGISSKADIEKLRVKSTMAGFSDPSFGNFGGFDSGFGSFDGSPVF
jgi:fumarate reductase iron-sulfur subunit